MRFFARIFRSKRRTEHLNTQVFRPSARLKNLLTFRQKVLLVVTVIVVGVVIGFGQFSGFFDIKKVTILRNSLDLPTEDIELTVRELALGKNIFQVDIAFLAKAVQELRPDTSRVVVRRAYPGEIQVEVFKFPVVAELRVGTDPVYINEKGYRVFGETPDKDTLQLTLGETLNLEDSKRQVVNPTYLASIREAVSYFESLTNLKILNTKFFPISREVHLKTEKNFDVWIDLTQDYRIQLDKLTAASEALQLDTKSYSYIDLRIRGKIFCKPN
jgi:cell division septal protein FtsQ